MRGNRLLWAVVSAVAVGVLLSGCKAQTDLGKPCILVKKDPNVTAEDIIKFAATQLTAYKVPKQIEFRDALPKTNVGKILRRELRDEKKAAA